MRDFYAFLCGTLRNPPMVRCTGSTSLSGVRNTFEAGVPHHVDTKQSVPLKTCFRKNRDGEEVASV